ncbi:hypothetical protein G5T42_17025 [Microbacterium sp. 4R-513]|uniref:hypothetical protein n=1 Tax=Microbacterium sp. 4R-513 TaxID=2567934 RepID=UPI0013E1C496|nr:hypothetical protein [Microbacterium sp. 4R-513]QIG40962.1 hypothetical protein G5T42_17025 [Microbacterium sp. 4R-513]
MSPSAELDAEADQALRSAAAAVAEAIGITVEPGPPEPGTTWGDRAAALVAPLLRELDPRPLAAARHL